MTKWMQVCLVSLFVLGCDQASKSVTLETLAIGQKIGITEFLNWTLITNRGAAFGILSEQSEVFRKFFFSAVTLISIVIGTLLTGLTPSEDRWSLAGIGLVLGGALGNWNDRLRYGYVIDWIEVYLPAGFSLPAFNFADVAITCGAGLLVVCSLLSQNKKSLRHEKETF